MACDEIRDRLSEYIDGYLPRPDAEKVRGHLLHCAPCRQELKSLVITVKALRALPEQPAPVGFAARLEARLAEPTGWRRLLARIDQALAVVPLKALTAAAAATFVLVFLLSTGNQLPTHKINLAHHNDTIPGMQNSTTEPLPVEFAGTHPGAAASGVFLDTPIDFITQILKNDPDLKGLTILPHPRGNGALLSTPEYLYEITVDPAEYPIIQAYVEQQGGALPQTLKQARAMYPIYIRALPSPNRPIDQPDGTAAQSAPPAPQPAPAAAQPVQPPQP